MSYHAVLDAEELRRALDTAPIEEVLAALVRRGARLLALAEAAAHEASVEQLEGRVAELERRCAASCIEVRKLSDAMHVLAPASNLDFQLAGYSRAAATFDRLTAFRLRCLRKQEVGHA